MYVIAPSIYIGMNGYCSNLISLTKLMEEGHKVIETKKDGLSVKKGGWVIKFDIRAKTD